MIIRQIKATPNLRETPIDLDTILKLPEKYPFEDEPSGG